MYQELLHNEKGFWGSSGPYSDIVLSSRVRLARNFDGLPFVRKMMNDDFLRLRAGLERFAAESGYRGTILADLNKISNNEKRYLRERNIITYEMEISDLSHVVINETEDFTIMVNDEDHVRIQVIKPGLQFQQSYLQADRVDDELNRFIPYAFSPNLGYLTSCPSNLGTGLKVSAILHLPVLTLFNKIPQIMPKIKKVGINLTGTTGDGIKTIGSIYQIYNRVTLGISEVDIIELLDGLVNKILELEDSSRDKYISESRIEAEDLVWRSSGILSNARKISYTEAIEHLSNLRLGVILAVIKNTGLNFINDLMVNIQWSHLQKDCGVIFSNVEECDEYRAVYLRNSLQKGERKDV